ncbi:MAG: putative glycoside hydrolase [Candidatus Paceibacteria bacterium]
MNSRDYFIIFILVSALSLFLMIEQIQATKQLYSKVNSDFINKLNKPREKLARVELKKMRYKPERIEARGVYLTARSAGNPQKVNQIIRLIEQTQLNSVVIDIKDFSGRLLYDSKLELAEKYSVEENRIGDIEALLTKLHQHNIYTIARISVFQDTALAESRPDLAIQNKEGEVWRNAKGLAWTNPAKKEVWEYNIAIAKEAAELGFDEVNFDYVRFPSDGDTSKIKPQRSTDQKQQVMAGFYEYISKEMRYEPVWTSLDFFGMTMESKEGLSIGQNLKHAVDEVDYISPMMYPSHYPKGHIGFENPAEHPGKILENGLRQGKKYFEDSRAQVRPWIQAFGLNYDYDREKMQAQIKTVEKYTDAGWLLWNARNVYSKHEISDQ